MNPEPGDPNREVSVNETFHVQTDDELTEKELKQIEADDQAIQTILLGLFKDIYAAVDSCETAQEIWLRISLDSMLAECRESEWVIQNAVQNPRVQNVGNQNGLIVVSEIANQNPNGNGNLVAARAEGIVIENNDGSAEVHNNDNCYDNRLFNMFTQEEQYTELLEPIPDPHEVGEIHALSKPVTSNTIPLPQELKVVKNDKVIAPGMFRINPFKLSREEKQVPNKVRASVRINMIIASQPPVITKKVVNSDSNGLSSTGVDNTAKTRRPQPRSNTKNKKQQSLYDGKVLLEKHDPPIVHDSEETLQLAQEIVSQDIRNIVQKESVVDTSDLQTEFE
nr:hypothetical protein [Tanacetum cinerariifolium]